MRDFAAAYYERHGRWDEAEAQLSAWRRLDPRAIEPHLRSGRLALRRGQPERGLALLRAVAEERPDDPRVLAALARGEAQHGARVRAVALYERLVHLRPRDPRALRELAALYGADEARLERAQALAERALEIAPDDVQAADTLGWILHRRGTSAQAVALLKRAAASDRRRPVYQYHLGMALLAAGARRQGRAALLRALALGGDFPEARRALAQR